MSSKQDTDRSVGQDEENYNVDKIVFNQLTCKTPHLQAREENYNKLSFLLIFSSALFTLYSYSTHSDNIHNILL